MREPSLHITRRGLIEVLRLTRGTDMTDYTTLIVKADEFLRVAKPYSVPSRGILVSTDRIQKKADKLVKASTEDTYLMSRVLFLVRKQLKHKGVTQVAAGQRDWELIRQIAHQANEFVFDFEFPSKREGYIEYIKVGCSKMQHYSTRKFVTMYTAICDHYQATLEIKGDPNTELSGKVHEAYRYMVAAKTGAVNNYTSMPLKYVGFVRAAEIIKKFGVSVRVYLEAQFSAMEKFDACPDPLQLAGDKAKERLNKYLFENNIDVRKSNHTDN
jgi:hypothetical protein